MDKQAALARIIILTLTSACAVPNMGIAVCDVNDVATIAVTPASVLCWGRPATFKASINCSSLLEPTFVIANITWNSGGGFTVPANPGLEITVTPNQEGCFTAHVHVTGHNAAGTHYCADGSFDYKVVTVVQDFDELWYFNDEFPPGYEQVATWRVDGGCGTPPVSWETSFTGNGHVATSQVLPTRTTRQRS